MTRQDLETLTANVFQSLSAALDSRRNLLTPVAIGRIQSIAAGVVRVTGLEDIGFEELVQFADGSLGMAYDLDRSDFGVILFGHPASLSIGEPVRRLGRVLDIPVGPELLGRVIDPLGRPLDGAGPLQTQAPLADRKTSSGDHGPFASHSSTANRNQGNRCHGSHRSRPA